MTNVNAAFASVEEIEQGSLLEVRLGNESVRFWSLGNDRFRLDVPLSDVEVRLMSIIEEALMVRPDSLQAMTGIAVARLIDRSNEAGIAKCDESGGKQ